MNPKTIPTADPTSIAVINTNVGYIQRDLSEIKTSIKELAGVYATKVFVDDAVRSHDLRLKTLEASSQLWRWLSPTLSAFASAVMAFFVLSYFNK